MTFQSVEDEIYYIVVAGDLNDAGIDHIADFQDCSGIASIYHEDTRVEVCDLNDLTNI